MAIELFLSDAQYHANSMLLDRLKERRGKSSRHIVIVPDRFTLNSERNILEDLGIKGAFDISVTSFRRLAQYVLGKKALKCMSAEASVMLLAKVIIDKKDELKYYVNAQKKSGFASEIYAVLTAVRNSGITVDMLKNATTLMPEVMRKKCEDVVTVYEGYLKALASDIMDGSSLLETFIEEIPENDYIATSDIYVTDYFSFTEVQRTVLFSLMERAKSVSIAMVKGSGRNSRIYPEKELARLRLLAKKAGVKCEEIYEEAPLSKARKKVADELFSYGKKQKITGGSGIRIYEAESVEEEITHLARRIKLLTKEGYRYKDIAVLSGDVIGSLPYIKKIFERESIPFFANEQKLLSQTPMAAFVVKAIKIGSGVIDRDDAVVLLKNPYSGVKREECEDFQIYALRYNVNYSRLTSEYVLGKGDKEYEGAKNAGKMISSLICPLPEFGEVVFYAEKVEEFIKKLELERKSKEYAEKQSAAGDLLASSTTLQSYTKLVKVLEELKTFAGKANMSREEFVSLFVSALSSVKIAYIPVFSDSVYIGGAIESRFSDCKVFFITGAVEGKLPAVYKREGIFGDREAEILKKADIDLSPTSIESGLEEKLHILQLLLMPKEKLFISYATNDFSRSELADGLSELFEDVKRENANTLREENFEEYIRLLCSSKDGARYALSLLEGDEKAELYLNKIVGDRVKRGKQETDRIENAEKLFFPYGTTTVTKLESYFRCPYRHFIEKGLGAVKMETAESKSYAGTLMHRIFELAIPVLSEHGFPKEGKLLDDICESVLEKVFSEENFAVLSTEKYRTTRRRLKEEGIRAIKGMSAKCADSKYLPTGFEVEFGEGKNAFCLEGENVKLTLRGKIDRVDEMDDKSILIDYKTGKAPASVGDVYYGTGVQLYVYMAALEKIKNTKAVGALYYPLVADYEKQNKTGAGRLKGFMLGSEMQNFDKNFDYAKSSENFAYDVKNGKVLKDGQTLLCTADELEKIKGYSVNVCVRAADEIALGFIEPTPFDNACEYCDYKVICKQKKIKERKSLSIKKEIIAGEKPDINMIEGGVNECN